MDQDKARQYIEALQEHYKRTGRCPIKEDFHKDLYSIKHLFGNWTNALKAAGLQYTRKKEYSKEQLKKTLLDYYVKYNKSPRTVDCSRANGLYAPVFYLNTFQVKTWAEVLTAVGLGFYQVWKPSVDDLKQALLDFEQQHGKLPGTKDCTTANGLPAYETILKAFGVSSWQEVIKKIGLKPNRTLNPSIAQVKNSLLNFYVKHKRAPKASECLKANGLYSKNIYYKKFGVKTWTAVLKTAGLDRFTLKSPVTEDKNKALKVLLQFIKKEKITTEKQYKLVYKKHQLPSTAYINQQFGGWRNLLKKAGLWSDVDKKKLINAIIEHYKQQGKSPTMDELAKRLQITPDRIHTAVGNYNQFLQWLGMSKNKEFTNNLDLTKEEVKRRYIELSNRYCFPNGATVKATKQLKGMPSYRTIINHFGSFTALKQACGYTRIHMLKGRFTKAELLMLLKKEYLKYNRRPTTKEINSNKELPNQASIKKFLGVRSLADVWIRIEKKL